MPDFNQEELELLHYCDTGYRDELIANIQDEIDMTPQSERSFRRMARGVIKKLKAMSTDDYHHLVHRLVYMR